MPSKYCSDSCGFTHGQALLETCIKKLKQRAAEKNSLPDQTKNQHGFLVKLSHADRQDYRYLLQLKREKRDIMSQLTCCDRRLDNLLNCLARVHQYISDVRLRNTQEAGQNVEAQSEVPDLCGFDSRLIDEDMCWKKLEFNMPEYPPTDRASQIDLMESSSNMDIDVEYVGQADSGDIVGIGGHGVAGEDEGKLLLDLLPLTMCRCSMKKCAKHRAWFKIRKAEIEFDRIRLLNRLQTITTKETGIQNRLETRQADLGRVLLHKTINETNEFEITSSDALISNVDFVNDVEMSEH
ncbi:hypothetical protein BKA69DRAFT_1045122 [Paraphysoderma sedebokerense]|nr:hypothetical protein BKA69DRAFT_1045122 [Paraphysoderma sedebokerense]